MVIAGVVRRKPRLLAFLGLTLIVVGSSEVELPDGMQRGEKGLGMKPRTWKMTSNVTATPNCVLFPNLYTIFSNCRSRQLV